MAEVPAKRIKLEKPKAPRRNLENGSKGVIVSCNFREKDSIRETYQLLNHYFEHFHSSAKTAIAKNNDEEEDDISKDLQKAIEDSKEKKPYRFQVLETGAQNFIFIKADLLDVTDFVVKIYQDLLVTQRSRTKHVLRFVPIEVVCKATISSIVEAAGKLFDQKFLKEPKTFAVVCNRRLNNSVGKDEVIKELADLVTSKNINNKVNLKNPEATILVEIVKGHACIGVLPDFHKFRKYNLSEVNLMIISSKEKKHEEKSALLEKPQVAQAQSCNDS